MKTKTQSNEQIKQLVKEKYREIADQTREQNASSCCGAGCCSSDDVAVMAEDYSNLEGYVAEADLGLGCGIPLEYALINAGDTVIDLGSGAGNDCFVARSVTGEKGKIIGIDFTEKMITKARANAEKLHYNNVEFRYGDIENIPVNENTADVVISNCVLNLVPDKEKAFTEMFRILKPGGHFSISDIVLDGYLPERLEEVAEMYVGCITGAIQKSDYISLLKKSGFTNIIIQKEKLIAIPENVLDIHLSEKEAEDFRDSGTKILSVTVYGEKPAKETAKKANKTTAEACCEPGCCGN